MNIKRLRKHGWKETFKNFILVQKAKRWASSYKRGEIRKIAPPIGYRSVFKENFNNNLNETYWRVGQPWGEFHPGHLYQYYDTTGEYTKPSNQGLVLSLRNVPKKFKRSEMDKSTVDPNTPEEFTIETVIGILTSKIGWKYGWFESWIKLPEGQSYWPAFWFSGINSWPPEIDVLEAYSDIGPRYEERGLFRKIPDRKIQPNLHYGVEGESYDQYGAYNAPIAKPTQRFVQYVCHWDKNFIRIYYDGMLIFETKNPEILKWYNGPKDELGVLFNHGRTKQQPKGLPQESDMIIQSFSVYQKI
jgi:hypothetical protein